MTTGPRRRKILNSQILCTTALCRMVKTKN
jgi:hypothetical protein